MERDVRYFWVGLFVMLAVTGTALFGLWLAGSYDGRNYDRYTVYYTSAIAGLSPGSIVRYQGIEVGSVSGIRLSEKRQDLVKVDIQIQENTPIRGKSIAILSTSGVTGVAFIDIQNSTDDKSAPRRVKGEKFPVITGRSGAFTELFKNVPEITENLLEASRRLNGFLDDETLASVRTTAANIARISQDFNGLLSTQNIANVSKTLENAAVASEDFGAMAKRLDNAAKQIEETATKLSSSVERNEENLTKFTREGLDQIIRLSEETRAMTSSIRTLADRLGEDPSQVIYQPSYNGVEIPND